MAFLSNPIMHQRYTRPSAHKGLSLVNLLVSLAIVSILAALVLTSIDRVRQSALQVRNVSNLRSIGLGILNYAADNDGNTPQSIQFVDNDWRVISTSGNANGSSQMPPRHLVRGGYATIDNFYSPFATIHADRPANSWASPNRIGYYYIARPRNPYNGRHPPVEEMYNCSIQESPNAIMYFNPPTIQAVEADRYTFDRVSVLYLDASVSTFTLPEVQGLIERKEDYTLHFLYNK